MCGIAGILRTDGSPIDEDALAVMREAIRHRGPDDSGTVIRNDGRASVGLTHTRLSILDTSSAGHQPMGTADGALWLTYNGEIYNFAEVRAKLKGKGCHFASGGDTEVLLRAYEEWGPDCLTHFNGMFSFAVWDARRQELFAARDRLGIKPFHYSWDGRTLAFCSELGGLAAVQHGRLSQDPAALGFYFTLGYVPAPLTIYREIRKLEAGHWLRLRGGDLTTGRYWDVDFARKEARPLDVLLEELVGKLRTSVTRQLVSDVPLGVLLSGGIDSGAVAALAAEVTDGPIRTFSIGFAECDFDETPRSRLVAARYHTIHREFTVTQDEVTALPTLVRHFGEPFADSSALPTYFLSELTRQHVKVALSGDGGDELFCGYTIYLGHQLSELYRILPRRVRHAIQRATRAIRWSTRNSINRVICTIQKRLEDAELGAVQRVLAKNTAFPADFKEGIAPGIDTAPVEHLFDRLLREGGAESFLDRIAYLQLKLSLPDDMLTKVDRMSMAHGLEVRVPLLDHEFVEYVATVPVADRFRYLRTKWLLRKAMEPYLPAEVLWRPKQGFGAPVWYWSRCAATSAERPPARSNDVRDGNAWWGQMMYQEWHRQTGCGVPGRALAGRVPQPVWAAR